TARRNRLFGVWAAEKLGLAAGEPVETYAKAVVAADFEVPGDDDVIAKVRADLDAKGLGVTDAELRAELARAAAMKGRCEGRRRARRRPKLRSSPLRARACASPP